jgi:putative tricarboxylic transport membrane protein
MVVTDLALLLILAVVLGALVGILPGLSPLLGLVLTLPLVSWAPVWAILIFWTCYLTVTQYYGSVSAILFKVPGETSSLPVLSASGSIKGTRAIVRSLQVTAFSSLLASMVGIIGLALVILFLEDSWNNLFRTNISVIFLSILTVLIISRQGAWFRNSVLIFLGLFLSNVGSMSFFNSLCGQSQWTCFTLNPTDIGLAIICMYVVPYLFFNTDYFDGRQYQPGKNPSWYTALRFWPVASKHAILGWFMGFVPGMGVTLSSNTSAAIETGNKPRRLRIMSAAESANNSSVISCTIPFLFVGLPITSTELLLDNWLLINKAANVNAGMLYEWVSIHGVVSWPMWSIMLTCLAFTSIICFYLTSRFVPIYLSISQVPGHLFGWGIKLSVVLFIWLFIANSDLTPGSTLFTMIFFTAIGIWSQRRGYDVVALPIAMAIGSFAIDKFSLAFQLWS